uniref:C-type lectin domain containing 11A n=1 Tax=Pygocentrus nattereri TaxID=42514 RepID=A0A3B4EH28_PYGNA
MGGHSRKEHDHLHLQHLADALIQSDLQFDHFTQLTTYDALTLVLYRCCYFVLAGCVKGQKVGHKCFLVYRTYETYMGASQKCQERGGRMAMPRDRREQEALADYVKSAFHPGNWPVWLGINDLRSEGLYLFEDTTRVTYFQWRKHFLSSQPDGGKRENCVAMSSDDGDWWDNYCDRRMYYLCEFDA